MAIALLGLIFVQSQWMKVAFKNNEKQFDQSVRRALKDVVRNIEQKDALNYIINDIYNFQQSQNPNLNSNYVDTIIDFNITHNGINIRKEIQLSSDEKGGISANFFFETAAANDTSAILQNPNSAQSIYNFLEHRSDLINKVLQRSLNKLPDIKTRLAQTNLNESIGAYLESYGIKLPFEYAIVDGNNNIAMQSELFVNNAHSYLYKAKLFPNDFIDSGNYISIYFPRRKQFIYQSIGTLGGLSSILTIVIIILFTVTLYIIFRQKKLSDIKNDFVSNMTHELKTPISTISLASQMLGDKNIPNEKKNIERISDIISQESKRLGYQVEKVLQTAAFDNRKMKLIVQALNFHDIVENVMMNFAIQVENKGGLLIPSLHAELAEIEIDKVHMTNVVSNLLDNALKYCDKVPEIIVETQNKNDALLMSVRDNGIGISKANQKRIFDRFYRVSTGNIHNIKGFGLGLSYVRRIVEEHNGKLSVESELGVGSIFTIELPLINKENY